MPDAMDVARTAIAAWQDAAARHRAALAESHEATLKYLNILAAITPYEHTSVGEQAEEDTKRWESARLTHQTARIALGEAAAEVERAEQAAGEAADISGRKVAIERASRYRDS